MVRDMWIGHDGSVLLRSHLFMLSYKSRESAVLVRGAWGEAHRYPFHIVIFLRK
jgi:hypothetical protein